MKDGSERTCSPPDVDFEEANIYPKTNDEMLLTLRSKDTKLLHGIFLLKMRDCSLTQVGRVDIDPKFKDIEMMQPVGLLDNKVLAIEVHWRKNHDFGKVLILWNSDEKKVVKMIEPQDTGGYWIWHGRVDQNDKLFVIGDANLKNPSVQLYDNKFVLMAQRPLPAPDGIAAFSKDGKYMAFTYLAKQDMYSVPTLEIYDVATGTKIASTTYQKHTRRFGDFVSFLTFTPDSKYVMATSEYTTIWLVK